MNKIFVVAMLSVFAVARGQSVINGSFEADTFGVAPGAVASNVAITGWSVSHPERSGLNPAGGTNDFANNGAVPAGTRVAWIQSEALQTQVLSQVVSGFTPGQAYKISMRVNAKTGTIPRFQLGADGVASVTGDVTAVGGTTAYRHLATVLNATSTSHSIEIGNLTGVNTNSILLVDDVSISAGAGNWSFFKWTDDASSGVTTTNIYTHAYSFGAAGTISNTTINGVLFTAAAGANPAVAGSFSTAGLTTPHNVNDANVITASGGGSAAMMRRFVYNTATESITLFGLTPGVEYVFTVYSVGWSAGWRTATFENGTDRLSVNQEQFGPDQGIAIQHRYTAPPSGSITLSWTALKSDTTIHVYGFSNRTAGDTPPFFVIQPRDRTAAHGSLTTFRAPAFSTQPMGSQWMKNGTDIVGETNDTLTVGPVSAVDIAGYSLRISNALGVATSAVANLTVGHISNPSFEADVLTNAPGYVSGNFPINGWDAAPGNRVAVNPLASGQNPFVANGVIPHGTQYCILQTTSTLSTVIGGLTNGAHYTLNFRFNARTNTLKPLLHVSLDGASPVDARVMNVGPGGSYLYGAVDFMATGITASLVISNDTPTDTGLLVDDFSLTPSGLHIGHQPWLNDSTAGLSPTTRVTHAYKFNHTQSAVISNFIFTGIAGVNPAVAGRFATTGFGSAVANDANNITSLGGGSAILARDFAYGGTSQILVITGLVPGVEYEASLYSVAWDVKAYGRTLTFNADGRRQTINQDHYDNNNGIRITARYTATTNGTGTITLNPTDSISTFHLYGFMNREVLSTNAPVIYVQPSTGTLFTAVGETITNNQILVGGAEPLYFQWYRDGGVVTGQTERVLNLTATSPADSGDYTLVVSNAQGVVTSSVFAVDVGIAPPNWSFEVNTYITPPGYQDSNGGIITSWIFGPANVRLGLNPAASSPFANNGTIPHGSQVAFIQDDTTLSTLVTGLTPGLVYHVRYYVNARAGFPAPTVQVEVDGAIVTPATVVNSGAYVARSSSSFVATNDTIFVTFRKGQGPVLGDSTLLLDAISIHLSDITAPFIVAQPPPVTWVEEGGNIAIAAQVVGLLPMNFQWQRNGADFFGLSNATLSLSPAVLPDTGNYTLIASNAYGVVTSTVARLNIGTRIPGLFNTGHDDSRQPLSGGSTDPHYRLTTSPDPLFPGPAAIVLGDTFPVTAYLPNTTTSRWIAATSNPANVAIGSYTYAITFLIAEQDPAQIALLGRIAADDSVTNILLNGTSLGITANGFTTWTPINITNGFLPGLNTLEFQLNNSALGPCALRTELTALGIPTEGNAPVILASPASLEANPGENIRLQAGVFGSTNLIYQWYFNTNTLLTGATNHWLQLTNITEAQDGWYTLRVTNSLGSAATTPARLTLLGPLPLSIGGGGANLVFRWKETSESWALFETENLLADPVIWNNSDAPISNVTPWKIITIPPTNVLKYYRLQIVPST